MTDLSRHKQAFIAAHRAGDTASAQALADFIRKNDKHSSPASTFVSRGVARTVGGLAGLPADLLTAGGKAVGLIDEGFEPVIGSKSLQRGIEGGLNAISKAVTGTRMTPHEDEVANTLGARVAQGVGDVTGAVLPMGMAAKALSAGTGAIGGLAKSMMRGVVSSPKKAAALELISGAGMGAGGYAAKSMAEGTPYEQQADMAGEIVGGMLSPAAAMTALKANIPALVYKGLKKTLVPFTEAGGRVRASNRLANLTVDKQNVLEKMNTETIADLTPAQKSGENELIALEARIAETSPEARQKRQEQLSKATKTLEDRMVLDGEVGNVTEEIAQRKQRILQKATDRRDDALQNVKARMDALEPKNRSSQSGEIVKEELEDALSKARAEENELWAAIPPAGVPTGPLKREYSKILMEVPLAQRDLMPVIAEKMLGVKGEFPSAVNLTEMQGLRSQLLEDSRLARAAGQYNKARITDKIADAVLEEMGAASGNVTGPVGQAMRDALDYSRTLNQTFKQGSVGRILAPDRLGADKIAPEMTLEAILGAGRVRGDVGLQSILGAADTPQTRQAVADYMLGRLNQSAVRDGTLNPIAAEKFIKQNADILDKFPKIRTTLTDAVKYQRDVMRLDGRLSQLEKNLSQPQKSAAAMMLNAPVEKEIDVILKSRNPAQTARNVRNMVRNNKDASDGLKAGMMENILNKAKTGDVDDFGNDIVSGNKLFKFIMDTRNRSVVKEILGDNGINEIEQIAKELSIVEKVRNIKPTEQVLTDMPNKIISLIATTIGARGGAQLGAGTSGASLKTASAMSNEARKLLQKLTSDKAGQLLIRAAYDEELYKILFSNIATPAQQKQSFQRLNAWIASTAPGFLEDENNQEDK